METVSDRRRFALRRVTVQQYTARGQVGTMTRYTDLAGTTKVGDSLYAYDDGGRLTQLLHRDATTGTLALYTYAFDLADRMTSKTENGTYTSYQYDNSDQLTRDGAATFSYDDTGNRTNPGYATTTGNRMTTDGVWTYTYDDVGNVTSRSKGTGTITWDYSYDHNNQMLTASYQAFTWAGVACQSIRGRSVPELRKGRQVVRRPPKREGGASPIESTVDPGRRGKVA